MTSHALIQACEERLVNCWPAVQTLVLGDWVLRFANGYSGRANSASALRPGADLAADDLAHLCALYRAAGLSPAIRVTPLSPAGLGARLVAAGWQPVVTSIGMVAHARDWKPDVRVTLDVAPSVAWISGVSQWQDLRKRNGDHLAAIVRLVRLPAAFATLHADGRPVGYGMSVLDRGMAEIGSVVLGPLDRGKGLGRALVETLLDWAARNGAGRVFLQVEENNAVAIRLYRALGFEEVYRYTEYRL